MSHLANLQPGHFMPNLRHLIPLLTAAGILLAGNGIQGTLITLRASAEGFGPVLIGLIGTAYFAGFALSCVVTPQLIRNVGHIRVFAALATTASAGTLALVLVVDPYVWLLIRFTTGFCFSGLFTVMESWLNASSGNADRARVFSIYRLVDLGAVAGTQFLLPVFGTGGFELFAITAIFFSLSLVPVSLADRSNPKPPQVFKFNLRDVWIISPLACLGCLTIGLTNSAFRFIGPLYADRMGLDTTQIAIFISAEIVGGAILQFPLGYMSDRYDRRWIVVVATLGAAFAGLFMTWTPPGAINFIYFGSFLFGAFAIPLYSLSVAHANDRADQSQFVLLAAGLLFIYALGASVGPLIGSLVIDHFGAPAFFTYTSVIHVSLVLATLYRMARRPRVTAHARGRFAMLLRTSPMLARMATRMDANGSEKRP